MKGFAKYSQGGEAVGSVRTAVLRCKANFVAPPKAVSKRKLKPSTWATSEKLLFVIALQRPRTLSNQWPQAFAGSSETQSQSLRGAILAYNH